jgi:hypothetical protein
MEILHTVPFWLRESRKKVTGYAGIPGHGEPPKVCGSMNSFARVFEKPPKVRGLMKPQQGYVRPRGRKERICILHNVMMSIDPGASQCILSVTESISIIPVSQIAYT